MNDVLGTSDPLVDDSRGAAEATALEIAIAVAAASHDAAYRAVSTDTNY